jgi:hypothetical protein
VVVPDDLGVIVVGYAPLGREGLRLAGWTVTGEVKIVGVKPPLQDISL